MSSLVIKQRSWLKKLEAAPMVQCACGCKKEIKSVDNYGRPKTFISGHNARKYEGPAATRWAAQQRYRSKHPAEYLKYKRDYRRAKKIKAMALLGSKCKKCGLAYSGTNGTIFDFHHRDPEFKEEGITRMLTNKAWATTLLELQKCDLLCRNCHMQLHGGEW